jgi:hypothetical protein
MVAQQTCGAGVVAQPICEFSCVRTVDSAEKSLTLKKAFCEAICINRPTSIWLVTPTAISIMPAFLQAVALVSVSGEYSTGILSIPSVMMTATFWTPGRMPLPDANTSVHNR